MPYQQNIPRPTDQLNVSQGDIQQNFLEIYNWVAVNHDQFDTPNAGKHTQVTLPNNPAPLGTLVNEANIWSDQSALTGETELFWRREAGGDVVPWTAWGVPFGNDWTFFPSGQLIKWGTANSTGTGFSVVFPANAVTIPAFAVAAGNPSLVLVSTVSNAAVAASVVPGTITSAGFVVNTYSTVSGFAQASEIYWVAIGIGA